jgi:hypothetical protein
MMKESNQLETYFITIFRSYCYVSMSFSLKNAGTTYQRCMLKCFGDLVRETIEAYMDDIVVKSKRPTSSWQTSKKLSRDSERMA